MNSIGFKHRELNSEEDLNVLLKEFPNIDTSTWDKPVSALYSEIENGECVLGIEDGKLHRRVDVVSVKCFHTNEDGQRFQICEEKQVFNNGVVRERGNKYVAEKLKVGETPEQCAIRGLAEELQIEGPDVQVIPLIDENTCKKRESTSYKGIQCSYNAYIFSCEIFKTHYKDSYVEKQSDKETFFTWIKI